MFGEPGKSLENSLKMGRKIGQAFLKWFSHFTKPFWAQSGKLSDNKSERKWRLYV